MNELEDENRRLHKMVVDERLKADIVTEDFCKKVVSPSHRLELGR